MDEERGPGQVWYWSDEWQAAERESLDAQARGDAVVFSGGDAGEIVRWLLDGSPIAPLG